MTQLALGCGDPSVIIFVQLLSRMLADMVGLIALSLRARRSVAAILNEGESAPSARCNVGNAAPLESQVATAKAFCAVDQDLQLYNKLTVLQEGAPTK